MAQLNRLNIIDDLEFAALSFHRLNRPMVSRDEAVSVLKELGLSRKSERIVVDVFDELYDADGIHVIFVNSKSIVEKLEKVLKSYGAVLVLE